METKQSRMMKKQYIPIIFVTFMIMWSNTSCSNNEENDVPFKNFTVDRDTSICTDSGAPICKVHINLMYADNTKSKVADTINKAIISKAFSLDNLSPQQAVDAFTDNYLNDYKKNLKELYKADKDSKNKSAGWYDYHYVLNSSIQKGSKDVLIYILHLESYEGGVHGISQDIVLNFDTKNGKLFAINDLFVSGYEHGLNEILLKALEDKTGCKNINELHNKGYLLSTDIYPSDNFMLNEDDITFIYNRDEIAPYDHGATELTISNSDLDKLLK
jgi:hypothetical protein